MRTIYLDNAATTPVSDAVRDAIAPFLEAEFGNPSSRHPLGVRAAEALDEARRRVARAVGARARDVLFTSGGTEANNLAVIGAARARGRGRVVIGPTEHPSVRASAEAVAQEGFDVEQAELGPGGVLDLASWDRLLSEDTVVVAQMLVSNELGTIYPVSEVARLARRRAPRAHVHVDAVQGLGKVELDLDELGADSLGLSSHKVHGLKGTGALVTRAGVRLAPLVFGGGQQGGVRPGTENVVGAVAFGEAALRAAGAVAETRRRTAAARAALARGLEGIEGAELLLPGDERVDAICAVRFPGAPAEAWQHHLEARGIYASIGSACQAAAREVSPSLAALGLNAEEAKRVMRFSFSHDTTVEDVEAALEALASVAPELEALS